MLVLDIANFIIFQIYHGDFYLAFMYNDLQRFRFVVFNATFNNISVILWRAVLMVEVYVTGENHRLVTSPWQTLSHNVVSSTPRHVPDKLDHIMLYLGHLVMNEFKLTTSMVMGTDCTDTEVVVNSNTIRSWPWQPLNYLQTIQLTFLLYISYLIIFRPYIWLSYFTYHT